MAISKKGAILDKMLFDTKLQVARAQLYTAMDLFLRDKDPISIQVLACGAAEVLEKLANISGEIPISTHILKTHPSLDIDKLYKARNLFWNSFKHVTRLDGNIRDEDAKTIRDFSDVDNDMILFLAWFDYMAVSKKLPVSAQVFQVWFYALKPDKLDPSGESTSIVLSEFPNLSSDGRKEQKRRLRRAVERYRKHKILLADPRTEA